MTDLWVEISDTADLNKDGNVTLQELQVTVWLQPQVSLVCRRP